MQRTSSETPSTEQESPAAVLDPCAEPSTVDRISCAPHPFQEQPMRTAFFACLLSIAPASAVAQSHTIVALSHTDHTAYEVDPASGKILNTFIAANQPHEGV